MAKKAKVQKAENHERYLVTYADLITLLLVFFIVLYAGSQEDQKKYSALAEGLAAAFHNESAIGGAGGQSAVFSGSGASNVGGTAQALADFQSITQALQQMAQERGVSDRVGVHMEQDRVVIDLTGDLLFASGSAQLRLSAGPVLDAVAGTLRTKPNEIRVEGHTDNIPINTLEFNSNWELSAARATAVLRYLVDEAKLPANRLYAAGFGDTRPKADNATPEGRAANRRAEIVMLYPPGAPAASPAAAPGKPAPAATPAKKNGGH